MGYFIDGNGPLDKELMSDDGGWQTAIDAATFILRNTADIEDYYEEYLSGLLERDGFFYSYPYDQCLAEWVESEITSLAEFLRCHLPTGKTEQFFGFDVVYREEKDHTMDISNERLNQLLGKAMGWISQNESGYELYETFSDMLGMRNDEVEAMGFTSLREFFSLLKCCECEIPIKVGESYIVFNMSPGDLFCQECASRRVTEIALAAEPGRVCDDCGRRMDQTTFCYITHSGDGTVLCEDCAEEQWVTAVSC